MKKKILAGILIFVMLFGMTTTSFAADPTVQALYDACIGVKTAFEGSSMDEIKTAVSDFEAIVESMEELTEAQEEELKTLFGDDWIEVMFEYIMYYAYCATMVEMEGLYNGYLSNKNVKTAYDFVEMYDLFQESKLETPEVVECMYRLFPDIDTVYADAKTNMPSEKTLAIMDFYYELEELQYFWDYEEFKEALNDGLEEKLAELDELDQKTLDELSQMFEKPAADVIEEMNDMYYVAKMIEEIGDVYHAFNEKSNVKNAKAYIEKYETIIGEYSPLTKKQKNIIKNFFFDLKDVYKSAKKVIRKAETEPKDVVDPDDTQEIKSPQTGEQSNASVWMMMVLAGGLACALCLSERKQKEANS